MSPTIEVETMTFERFVESLFAERRHHNKSEPSLAEIADAVIAAVADGVIDDVDRHAVERAKMRGVEVWVESRLRKSRFQLRGVSVRRFAAALDAAGDHHWVDLQAVTAGETTADQKADIARHSWSVIGEAVNMIQEHRRILLAIGEPAKRVDARIRLLFEGAFSDKKDGAEP